MFFKIPSHFFLSIILFTLLFSITHPIQAFSKGPEFYIQEIDKLRTSLKRNPDNIDLLWNLARNYHHLGAKKKSDAKSLKDFKTCQDYSQKAIALNPNSAQSHFWLGLCYGKEAEIKGIFKGLSLAGSIKKEMKSVVRLDPAYNNAGGHRALGRLLYKLPRLLGGSMDGAVYNLEEAKRIAPYFSTNRLFLAEVYMEKKEYGKACEEVMALLEFSPGPDNEEKLAKEKIKGERLLKEIPVNIKTKCR